LNKSSGIKHSTEKIKFHIILKSHNKTQ